MSLAPHWLRVALAALALLAGGPLHTLLHHGGHDALTGHPEAHAGDCEHLADAPEGHDECTGCTGRVHYDTAPTTADVRTAGDDGERRVDPDPDRPRDHPHRGGLSSRGPPKANG